MRCSTRASCRSRSAPRLFFLRALRRTAPIMLLSFAALTCDGATEPGQGGRVMWQVAGSGWSITPSHDSSRVFFGTMDHRVIALDRETGK